MKNTITILLAVPLAATVIAQAPTVQWQRSLGGTNGEELFDIRQTADGGYIMTGIATSSNGDVSENFGEDDLWVVKLDSAGTLQWERSYGGSENDRGVSIVQTPDGGYIVGGITWSNDGDVTGHHGDWDIWVLRLDSSGDLLWQRSLGGPIREMGGHVALAPDGGFYVAGSAKSFSGDLTGNNGDFDFWIFKLAANGDLVWQHNFGGSEEDFAFGIHTTSDGGLIVCGHAFSANMDVTINQGWSDAWVIKLAANGDLDWKRTYGGSSYDGGTSIQQTTDGGYIMSGSTMSSDGDLTANNGGWDMWVLKLDPSGDIQWQTSSGGTSIDIAVSVSQTSDGGHIVAGHSDSGNGDFPINQGEEDTWLLRLDPAGALLWQRSFGGSGYDWASTAQQTADGGYIFGGSTTSSNGDVLANNGLVDFLVVKFGADDIGTSIDPIEELDRIRLSPNPAHDQLVIDLDLDGSDPVRMEIFNSIGQEVFSIAENDLIEGSQRIEIPVQDLRPGIYHLHLRIGDRDLDRKWVKF